MAGTEFIEEFGGGEELVADYMLMFYDFLRTFKENNKFKYVERVQELIREGRISLQIDYEDLLRFDPKLVSILENSPDDALQAFSKAVKKLVESLDPDYAAAVRRFYPRLTGWKMRLSIRELGSQHVGKLVMVDGIVVKMTTKKERMIKAVYLHVLPTGESHEFEWPPGEEELKDESDKPTYCPICAENILDAEGRGRGRGVFKLVPEKSVFIDWQKITVQEKPEDVPAGTIPRSVDVILSEDLVDTVRPGDRVSVIGVPKLLSMGSPKRKRVRNLFSIYLEANNVIVSQRYLEEVKLSPEDEEKILRMSRDPLIRRKIIASIAPTIYGHWDIKEAVALLLFGGVTKEVGNTRKRGEIHVLLLGDPGTAKSEMLQFAAKIAPRAVYTTGKGSSAAGLTAAVLRDKDTGEYFLEAGAMVLADGGIVCIDEIDKMREEDRSAIHTAMEQGFLSIAKAGIVAQLNARAAILAAGNPKHGRYIPELGPKGNINLPDSILSRFDLIFIVRDVADVERDRTMIEHILTAHEKPTEVQPEIPPDLLRKYIAYARKYVRPKLTHEAINLITEYFVSLRKLSAQNPEVPLPLTPRQGEGLIRLAEAYAKMALKDTVDAEDAAEAIRLMNSMLESVGLDVESNMIDIDLIMTGKPKSMREKEILVLKLIKERYSEYGRCVPHKELLEELREHGISDDTLKQIIKNLKRSGDVYVPKYMCYAPVE